MSWFDNTLVLRDFADALVTAEYIDSATDVLTKPYRYTNEYNIWKRHGYPSSDQDEGWEEFVSDLDDLNEDDEDDGDEE